MRFAGFFLLGLLWCSLPLGGLDFWDEGDPQTLARELAAAMTVPERASQVLMLAFAEPVPDGSILTWVGDRSLGGVKFFGWNAGTPAQVAQAVRVLQARAARTRFRVPLLVATDQEGGWVRHIKGPTSTTPGNLSLGASNLPADAWATGALLGTELRGLGVNMNFAPSVDLYTNPAAHVIGPRSFGQDPQAVGLLGAAYARGLASQGVIATAKHFPGHGNTADDSHGRLPVLDDDRQTLLGRELVPYRMLIADGLPAVMSGHIAFPRISGDGLPASLSPELINGLLRQDLGFTGVVLTDDLYMEGARPHGWTIAQAAVQALEAGNDLLLISKPARAQYEAWDQLVARAGSDPAFGQALEEATRRVLELKLRYLKGPKAVPLEPAPGGPTLPAPGSEALVLAATARGATLVAQATLPWTATDQGLLVITPYDAAHRSLATRFPGSRVFEYEYSFFSANPDTTAEIQARAQAQTQAGGRLVFVLSTPGSLTYLKALEPWREHLAVVSVLSPVYLREVPWVRDAVAVFGTNPTAFDVAAAVVAGELSARGRLPFRFGDFPWKKGAE